MQILSPLHAVIQVFSAMNKRHFQNALDNLWDTDIVG